MYTISFHIYYCLKKCCNNKFALSYLYHKYTYR